jgi:hypothetical protein
MIPSRRLVHQRGASIVTLLFVAIVIGFALLLGMRAFPAVNEYLTIRKTVTHIMKNNPSSPAEIRNAFEKAIEIEYSIKTIKPEDLDIQPLGNSGGFRTSFAYNVEIPIVEPTVYLLMKFDGSASSGGVRGP